MAASESMFVRTVLSSNYHFKSDDSSLALPSDDRLGGPEGYDGKQRLNRVEQQVQQLTLARKGKRATIKGSLSSSHLTSSAPLRNGSTKLFSFYDQNETSGQNRSVRRVDVSHWMSPSIAPVNGSYAMSRYGSAGSGYAWGSAGFTLPIMRSVSSADRLHRTIHHQNSAWSEVPRNTQTFVPGYYTTRQLPSRAVYEDNGDDVFLPESVHINPLRSEHQMMAWEKQTVPKAYSQQEEVVWGMPNMSLVRDIRERQGISRMQPSQASSLISMHINSVTEGKEQESAGDAVKRGRQGAPMTLRMAVNHLSENNTEKQLTAANFIQNQCFSSAEAKKMMFLLQGVPKLLKLLDSDSEEVQRAAAGALRNVLYENNENKMEVKDRDGIAVVLRVLKRNRDIETRRQLTGLLWNLSSHDMLKEQLCREAVQPLTNNVLVPCSGISEGEDPKLELLADTEVFLNATGCLRNVSSAGPNGRKSMRDCDGLIDSLVYYVRGTIADYKPDDKALENCVCILHNLTYQFESELPPTSRPLLQESRQSAAVETQRPGCLIIRGNKLSETDKDLESSCPMLEENGNPYGVQWLWSPITIRMYLSLLATSSRQLTHEASIGAMQNLTAGTGGMSQAMSNTIVKREEGLLQVKKMLGDGEEEVKRASVGLLKNISRYRELHADIIKHVLPELVVLLSASDTNIPQHAEVTSVCTILNNLSQESVQNARTVLNQGVLPKIIKISSKDRYGPTRTGQSASVLLHTLWRYSELHGSYKKAGYRKTDFINNRTVKAVNSARN
ncbi:plakophilin-2 [Trichomycterus rosablanca]|uniref:plakophilin-2 n=1 Tax=Trichomycterus rosablanca TaxID=2290929 RepID=UPI002F359587